jgi:hypothetical protein
LVIVLCCMKRKKQKYESMRRQSSDESVDNFTNKKDPIDNKQDTTTYELKNPEQNGEIEENNTKKTFYGYKKKLKNITFSFFTLEFNEI